MIDNKHLDYMWALLLRLGDALYRLLLTGIVVGLIFSGLAFYADEIYAYLAEPLLKHIPTDSLKNPDDVILPTQWPFVLNVALSLCLAAPFILYQLLAFSAPGFVQHRRRLVLPLLAPISLVFYGGIAFAYYGLLPTLSRLLFDVISVPHGVAKSQFLEWVLGILFLVGGAFEIPVFIVVRVWAGEASRKSVSKMRYYVIVLAFTLASMLIPEPTAQGLLAIFVWMLFELGLFFSRFVKQSAIEVKEKNPTLWERFKDIVDGTID